MLLRNETRIRQLSAFLIFLALPVFAAEEADPNAPPKADVPYLVHAGNLTEIVGVQANEEKKKDVTTYSIPGATSSVRTPLAGPEFLLQSVKLNPNELRLYRFEVRNGRREISFNAKKQKQNPQAYIVSVFPASKGVSKLRVDQSLERGEYCLTPDNSNDVFCFTIF